jgi:hypothetical protein
VEGNFFNDLVAFDLNTLQSAGNKWEMLIPNGGFPGQPVPPPRTNHSVVSWQDKLFLFGGTDGSRWFNDVWTYDPSRNLWSELDCIGYIPAPREGHAAALINDTMYIFGGRIQDGSDLGDLVAFKISARRWYMFQNMGLSPSPRSGHSMTELRPARFFRTQSRIHSRHDQNKIPGHARDARDHAAAAATNAVCIQLRSHCHGSKTGRDTRHIRYASL